MWAEGAEEDKVSAWLWVGLGIYIAMTITDVFELTGYRGSTGFDLFGVLPILVMIFLGLRK